MKWEKWTDVHTIVRTLKNRLGSSSPIDLVLTAKTPIGKVNPHQPYSSLVLGGSCGEGAGLTILNGNFDLLMLLGRRTTKQVHIPT
jgi:hypothetical protein